ncbi:MAG: ABC transporter ATP-binding protein, partial [Gemmatimonadaceae bacterium]|nr:ABC transporter ATP-binding protein [Gemmatimonadaceae bacterium]
REYTRRGHTIMMSTHTLETAELMCDRIGIMQRGQLVACGTMDELRNGHGSTDDHALEDIFLKLTGEQVARELVAVLDA